MGRIEARFTNLSGKSQTVFQPEAWNTYPWKVDYANVGTIRAMGRDIRGFVIIKNIEIGEETVR